MLTRRGITRLLTCAATVAVGLFVPGGACAVAAEKGDITLVTKGKSSHVIVVSETASPSEQYAAKEVQKYLAKMTGCELPIFRDKELKKDRPVICIGTSAKVQALLPHFDMAALKEEGIAIKTAGENVLLLGSATRGALYAAYTFLEDLGVRFYSPEVERVPQQGALTIPATDYQHMPSFAFRLVTYQDYLKPEYSCKQKINLNPFSRVECGGNIPLSIRHMTHTFYIGAHK